MSNDLSISQNLNDKRQMLNKSRKKVRRTIPSPQVDALVDEIIDTGFGIESFRKWYCDCIYTIGIEKTKQLMGQASDAEQPARLFSYLLKSWTESTNGKGN